MNTINWCGVDFEPCMEGGRIIHPNEPWCWYSLEEVHTNEDGSIDLGVSCEPKEIKYWDGKTYHPQWKTGRMRSIQDFGYGTFSADIMAPKGRNLCSAFWLCGVGRWPDHGEIDIYEAWSSNNASYYRFPLSWDTTNNVHYLDFVTEDHKHVKSRGVGILKQASRPQGTFVNYKAEWRPNKVTFFVNDKKVRTVGWDVCKNFYGSRMKVIFDILPNGTSFSFDDCMKIKNFRYEEL